jgi:aryl-alcohol dehydrogenase-like predicted oxidoreductase
MKAVVRISSDQADLKEIVRTAREEGLDVFEPYSARIMKAFPSDQDLQIAALLTGKGYFHGRTMASFVRIGKDLRRDEIGWYWLEETKHMDQILPEMVQLQRSHKIDQIGICHSSWDETRQARTILHRLNSSLYGVLNRFSLLNRDDEKNGFLAWCLQTHTAYWAEDLLADGLDGEEEHLSSLYEVMDRIGQKYGFERRQTAICWAASRGAVPVVCCQSGADVKALSQAVSCRLEHDEIIALEQAADDCQE